MPAQHLLSKVGHEPRDQRRVRETVAAPANVHGPIVSGPRIDRTEPHPVQPTDVGGRESMRASVSRPCSPLRGNERLRFGLLHLAHLGDAQNISQNAAAGARLKFRFAARGRVPSWCHANPWRFVRSLSIRC
jgi:hypothetical protein